MHPRICLAAKFGAKTKTREKIFREKNEDA